MAALRPAPRKSIVQLAYEIAAAEARKSKKKAKPDEAEPVKAATKGKRK